MTKSFSFSRHEQKLRPGLRKQISSAESTEDVKKFFAYTVLNLFGSVFQKKIAFEYEDIRLDLTRREGFSVDKRLLRTPEFVSVWQNSDLPHIVKRMAEYAIKHYKHLETHPDKTEAKMYHKEKI